MPSIAGGNFCDKKYLRPAESACVGYIAEPAVKPGLGREGADLNSLIHGHEPLCNEVFSHTCQIYRPGKISRLGHIPICVIDLHPNHLPGQYSVSLKLEFALCRAGFHVPHSDRSARAIHQLVHIALDSDTPDIGRQVLFHTDLTGRTLPDFGLMLLGPPDVCPRLVHPQDVPSLNIGLAVSAGGHPPPQTRLPAQSRLSSGCVLRRKHVRNLALGKGTPAPLMCLNSSMHRCALMRPRGRPGRHPLYPLQLVLVRAPLILLNLRHGARHRRDPGITVGHTSPTRLEHPDAPRAHKSSWTPGISCEDGRRRLIPQPDFATEPPVPYPAPGGPQDPQPPEHQPQSR